jgi:VanZ family protein
VGPIAWAVFILALTSIPNPTLPSVTNGDKLGHLSVYAVLGWLSMRAAQAEAATAARRRAAVAALAAISAFGALDEWHQQFIPGRSPDRGDWIADTVGAGLGILLAAAIGRRREQRT